jgi:hypothetical protein
MERKKENQGKEKKRKEENGATTSKQTHLST